MPAVARETLQALAGIAVGRADEVALALDPGDAGPAAAEADARTFALAKVAALIALDAPPASYAEQVASAVESGASAQDLLDVPRAIAPEVGGPRVVAAAPEIMLALGLPLPRGPEPD
jgi:hypothetical protein